MGRNTPTPKATVTVSPEVNGCSSSIRQESRRSRAPEQYVTLLAPTSFSYVLLRKGAWVKGDLSWRTFEFRLASRDYDATHGEALTRLFAAASVERSYSSGAIEHLWLNSITSPLLWQSLQHARAAGVEFLPGAGLAAIELVGGGEVGLDLQSRAPSRTLQVTPRISIGGQPTEQGRVLGASGVLDVEELAEEQLLSPSPRSVPPCRERCGPCCTVGNHWWSRPRIARRSSRSPIHSCAH